MFHIRGFQTFLPWRIQSVRGATHAAFLIGFISGAGQVPGIYSRLLFQMCTCFEGLTPLRLVAAQIFRSQYAPRCKDNTLG